MNLDNVVTQLHQQDTVTFRTKGNSMVPKIRSGDEVTVRKITDPTRIKRGDIVLARVGGRLYLHLVSAVEKDRVQISNNKGHVNGWTLRTNVYAELER